MVTGVGSLPRASSRVRVLIASGFAFLALAAVVAWWTWRALHDPHGYDFRLAYAGGKVAWATGRPQLQSTWTGTPLLAAALALTSRVLTLTTASHLLTLLNAALVISLLAVVLHRLRGVLEPGWWWATALALVSFGPMMSSVWWKQFNIIALVLAVAGFEALRRERAGLAGGLIGLSVAIKPLVFLLPVAMLLARRTRRAGVVAIVWIVGLTLAGQGLLAARAHDLSVLSPLSALTNFAQKTKPGHGYACMPLNFSPSTLLCKVAGSGDWTLVHVLSWAAVAILAVWAFDALRGRGAASWELFAFVCPLSVLLSPLDWSHYQIVLAPLFVLLLVGFTRSGAPAGAWLGLGCAFVLSSLMWEPYGTVIGAVDGLFRAHAQQAAKQVQDAYSVAGVAQFAQYVLLVTGVLWYSAVSRGARTARRPLAS